jgi:hypothetical protein
LRKTYYLNYFCGDLRKKYKLEQGKELLDGRKLKEEEKSDRKSQ